MTISSPADLTLATESIRSRTVAEWRRMRGAIGKRPAVFLLFASVVVERRQATLDAIEEKLDEEVAATGRQPSQESQIAAVFAHWQLVMDSPRSILDAKRKAVIKSALKTGYTVEQLCQAVDGCRNGILWRFYHPD